MSNIELKKLSVKTLENIILCEPITRRGKDHFDMLEHDTGIDFQHKISIENFYDDMYIFPKYDDKCDSKDYPPIDYDENLHCPYSVSEERFAIRKSNLTEFNKKFANNSENTSLLIITGVAGNGKSIEINRKIRNLKGDNYIPKDSNYIYYDLEEAASAYTRGNGQFIAPDARNVLWLFCISLLYGFHDGLIKKYKEKCQQIAQNYQDFFVNMGINATLKNKALFECIGEYDDSSEKKASLFEAMTALIDEQKPDTSIKNILSATMDFMYCIEPKNKNYIVFDNIEQYIKLNYRNIPIRNKSLLDIYNLLDELINNEKMKYKEIGNGEFGKAFKVLLVMRRNTGHNFNGYAHFAAMVKENGNDYTGHFDIWRIWEKKKEHIWEKYLKNKYESVQSKQIIDILDGIMNDNPSQDNIIGKSYQAKIAPLMNMGIRRNAGTQAYTVMRVFNILDDPYPSYITHSIFEALLQTKRTDYGYAVSRYMYRVALLEMHHKWMIIAEESEERFNGLLLGKLDKNKKNSNQKDKEKKYIEIRDVSINKTQQYCITYVRRILAYLSHFPYDAETYEVKSLYDIMYILFINPNNQNKAPKINENNEIDFLSLAKVLFSLGDMLHKETKGSPMIILDIADDSIDSENSEEEFAGILKKIWEGGREQSNANGQYNSSKFGARITDSGLMFLKDIQPSFSFFAALYCSEEVPLFFLKDIERIKFVIKTVYEEANKLCNMYEEVAVGFCDSTEVTLQQVFKPYLYKHNDEYCTFRERIKNYHIKHLIKYKDFLNKNSKILDFDDKTTKSLTAHGKYIDKYIGKYNEWKKDITQCF